jgi:CMP-N-acetylneuraminic acid synthetase
MDLKKIWAIIPARGGSKGIPRKNVRLLDGHPLIAYTIYSAKESDVFKHIIVSTENDEIADISLEYGAEVPFKRPDELAGDNACVNQAVRYTLKQGMEFYDEKPDAYAILYPTNPFRTPDVIKEALALLDSYFWVSTVSRGSCRPSSWYVPERNGIRRISNFEMDIKTMRRNGYLTATRDIPFRGENPDPMVRYFQYKEKINDLETHGYYVIDDDLCLLDLDVEADWRTAEWIIEHNWFSVEDLSKHSKKKTSEPDFFTNCRR